MIGGEASRGARGRFEAGGPVTAALIDLAEAYTSDPSDEPPVHVAKQHEGVPGAGWLVPVALVHRDRERRERDTRALATAAGVGTWMLQACVGYVELVAQLFAAKRPGDALRVATVPTAPAFLDQAGLHLIGVGPIDGLVASVWAIERDGNLASVLPQLVDADPPVESWVIAAAGGTLGVRDGCAAIPAHWRRLLPARQHDRCVDLADALALADNLDVVGPPQAVGQ